MALTATRAEGRSLILTLADPARRNALSADMTAEIAGVLDNAPADLGALIIEGAGGMFSAGADLKALSAALAAPLAAGAVDPIEALNAAGGQFFARFAALPFVTIAAVDGAALGGGMGLAAAADIVVAGPKARFALTETSLGLPPAQIAPYLIARLGERVARRLALTGAELDGTQAAAVGLADFYCETEAKLSDRLRGLVQAIARCGPRANAETKRLFRLCRAAPSQAYIAAAARSFATALRGAEGQEGLASLREKREPAWAKPPR